jgi:hypothetical protein
MFESFVAIALFRGNVIDLDFAVVNLDFAAVSHSVIAYVFGLAIFGGIVR